jgi:hypothetical protein
LEKVEKSGLEVVRVKRLLHPCGEIVRDELVPGLLADELL